MKNQIVIIEDNYCKYFAMKQVLEAGLKIKIRVVGARTIEDISERLAEIGPTSLIFKPTGGVAELLMKFKKRNVNRRNTEVTMFVTSEIEVSETRFHALLAETGRKKSFASAA